MSSMERFAAAAVMGLRPGGKVEGRATVPGSKSEAQRALVCAGLAEGATEIVGLPSEGELGGDVGAALGLIEAAGARVEHPTPSSVRILGRPPGPRSGWAAGGPVSIGESGTLARFATAAFALCGEVGRWHELRGEGSLLRRRSPPLFAALASSGVAIESSSESGSWPVRVRAADRARRIELVNPMSSQEVSALLIALAAHPGETNLVVRGTVPSRPYVDLTIRTLHAFQVDVATGESFSLFGPLRSPSGPIAIAPDASSAAVLLAAACLSGGRIEVVGIDARSAQPDVCVVEHLKRFGVEAGAEVHTLWARGSPSRGAKIDLSDAPDLAPVLAAVAAAVAVRTGEESRLEGLGTLPGKESSRIEVLARGLRAVGLDARNGPDFLEIRAGRGRESGRNTVLDPEADHRMAFAFALLGLVVDGVDVRNPGCVAKSWPGFWGQLEALGASVVGPA